MASKEPSASIQEGGITSVEIHSLMPRRPEHESQPQEPYSATSRVDPTQYSIQVPRDFFLFSELYSFPKDFNPEESEYLNFQTSDDPASLFNSRISICQVTCDDSGGDSNPKVEETLIESSQHFDNILSKARGQEATHEKDCIVIIIEDISDALIEIVGARLEISRQIFLQHQKIRRDFREDKFVKQRMPLSNPQTILGGGATSWRWFRLASRNGNSWEVPSPRTLYDHSYRESTPNVAFGQRNSTEERFRYAYSEILQNEHAWMRKVMNSPGLRFAVSSNIYRPYHVVTNTTFAAASSDWACAAEEVLTTHSFTYGNRKHLLILVDGERYHGFGDSTAPGHEILNAPLSEFLQSRSTIVRKYTPFSEQLPFLLGNGAQKSFCWDFCRGPLLRVSIHKAFEYEIDFSIALQLEFIDSIAIHWDILLRTISEEMSSFELQFAFNSTRDYGNSLGRDLEVNFPHWTSMISTWRYGLAKYQRDLQAASSFVERILKSKTMEREIEQNAKNAHGNKPKHQHELYLRDLLQKYNEILLETNRLLERNERFHQAITSSMSILESKNAIAEAQAVTRLTELAFIFIPMSFVASYYGMEVQEWDGMKPKLWGFWTTVVALIVGIYSLRLGIQSQSFAKFRHKVALVIRYRSDMGPSQQITTRTVLYFIFFKAIRSLFSCNIYGQSSFLLVPVSAARRIYMIYEAVKERFYRLENKIRRRN